MSSSTPQPKKFTLHFLQASRSIRTAWHLEILQIPYEVKFSPRTGNNGPAPLEFKAAAGGLGKFPTLEVEYENERNGGDGGKEKHREFLYESGNICEYVLDLSLSLFPSFRSREKRNKKKFKTVPRFFPISKILSRYLSDTFDPQNTLHLLPPPGSPLRYKTLQWIHASEATFLLHGLACLYVQWHQHDGDVQKTLQGLSGNVVKDLDYLESHLQKQEKEKEEGGGRYIMGGKNITTADIMMQFSVRFILMRELGTQGVEKGRWERVERWLELCEGTESYKRAVERTGFRL